MDKDLVTMDERLKLPTSRSIVVSAMNQTQWAEEPGTAYETFGRRLYYYLAYQYWISN